MAELAADRKSGDWLSLGHVIAAGCAAALVGPDPLKKLKAALSRGSSGGMDQMGQELKGLYRQMMAGENSD